MQAVAKTQDVCAQCGDDIIFGGIPVGGHLLMCAEPVVQGCSPALKPEVEWMCPKAAGIITWQKCRRIVDTEPGKENGGIDCWQCPHLLKLAKASAQRRKGNINWGLIVILALDVAIWGVIIYLIWGKVR